MEQLDSRQRYQILIERLGAFLKAHPQEAGDEQDVQEWCVCRTRVPGEQSESIACDIPDCRVIWYHRDCLSLEAQLMADRYEHWICPQCVAYQTLHLATHTSEALTDEYGLVAWNVVVENKDITDNDRALQCHLQDSQDDRHINRINLSDKALRRLETQRERLVTVENAQGIQLSALLWAGFQCVTRAENDGNEGFQLSYQLETDSESAQGAPDSNSVVYLISSSPSGSISIPVATNLLAKFSSPIRDLVKRFGAASLHQVAIKLPSIHRTVARPCVDFLAGEPLTFSFPKAGSAIHPLAKRQLLQQCHFAHVMGIPLLQNIAMHSLCAALVRNPDSWAPSEENARLFEKYLFAGNPARRMLMDQSERFPAPNRSGMVLPCNDKDRNRICLNEGFKALWGQDPTMALLPPTYQVPTAEFHRTRALQE